MALGGWMLRMIPATFRARCLWSFYVGINLMILLMIYTFKLFWGSHVWSLKPSIYDKGNKSWTSLTPSSPVTSPSNSPGTSYNGDFRPHAKDGIYTFVSSNGEEFQAYTKGGTHTMHHVCIEPDPSGKKVEIPKRWKLGDTVDLPRKLIVVYNSHKNESVNFKVGASYNSQLQHWPIIFRTGPPPSTHRYIQQYPAYFMITTCPGNLWHYLRDSLLQLYWTMSQTNRLNSTIPNMVYLRQPMYEVHKKTNGSIFCYNPSSFAPLLMSFSVREDFDTYHKAQDNICYQNAVFGQSKGVSKAEIAEYVTSKLQLSNNGKCGPDPGPVVTILQRTYRQILNAEDLKTAAIKAGFLNTAIVSFDDSPFLEQLSIIACTDMLVGVHGAGLEWTTFLRPNKALLEIAWPKKGWGFFYSNSYKNYRGIQTFRLEASEVELNFQTFADKCNGGEPLSEELKSKLGNSGPIKQMGYNQWKWADGIVNTTQFIRKLSEIKIKTGL